MVLRSTITVGARRFAGGILPVGAGDRFRVVVRAQRAACGAAVGSPGQAARWYSWIMPPRTSVRSIRPLCTSAVGGGTGRPRPRWGRAVL